MSWKHSGRSGGTWTATNDTKTEFLWGYEFMGRPHGHAVVINNELRYRRDIEGLNPRISGGTISFL